MYFMYDHVKPGTNTFVKVYCDTDSMAIAKDSFFLQKRCFTLVETK